MRAFGALTTLAWKNEIAKLAYIKQALADVDERRLYPHCLPKVRATSQQIVQCEGVLGFRFEPDHAELLLCANGWDGFLQTTNLFGTDDFLGSEQYQAAQGVLDMLDEGVFVRAGVPRRDFFPVGASLLDGDVFAMVKSNVRSPSRVFWFAGYEIDRYPSFSEFFLAIMDYNRLAVEKMRSS